MKKLFTSLLTLLAFTISPALAQVGGGVYGPPTSAQIIAALTATPATSAQWRAMTSDESGTGALLFAGGNIGAATGTSLALSNGTSTALTVTGTASFNPGGDTATLFFRNPSFPTYSGISFNGVITDAGVQGFFGGANADTTFYMQSVGEIRFRTGGNVVNGSLGTTGIWLVNGAMTANNATAIPAGGATTVGVKATSTANFGVFFGSGAPTLSVARGSLYLRSDGLPSYNTNGTTGWDQLAGLAAANTFSATQTFGGLAVFKNYTVGTLPTGVTYARAFVTDQLTACVATGLALTGGGGVTCPVFYNGAAWVGG